MPPNPPTDTVLGGFEAFLGEVCLTTIVPYDPVVVETTGLFSLLQLFSELGPGTTPRSVNGGREIFQFLFSAAIQVKCLILLDISCYIN